MVQNQSSKSLHIFFVRLTIRDAGNCPCLPLSTLKPQHVADICSELAVHDLVDEGVHHAVGFGKHGGDECQHWRQAGHHPDHPPLLSETGTRTGSKCRTEPGPRAGIPHSGTPETWGSHSGGWTLCGGRVEQGGNGDKAREPSHVAPTTHPDSGHRHPQHLLLLPGRQGRVEGHNGVGSPGY